VNKKTLFLILLGIILVPTSFVSAMTLPTLAKNVEATAVDIATPIVIIGWIIAGILYLTAAGSPEKIGTAKKALVACVIGTILVVLAIGSGAIIGVIQSALGLSS
jgi:quinol-cytochrome oxidoreductase complex cytochrome b subunit